MIKRIEDLNYYELLEISPQATPQEIHKAYERIRRVYAPDSVALYSLFSPEETTAITQRIEEAYRTLVYAENRQRYDRMLRDDNALPDLPPEPRPITGPGPTIYQHKMVQPALTLPTSSPAPVVQEPPASQAPPREPARPVSQFIGEFTGPAIKMLREQAGLSLRNIADMTKLNARYLEYIEDETYLKLPARAYIRGFLMLYAKALGCEPERLISDYLKRYDAAMAPKQKAK